MPARARLPAAATPAMARASRLEKKPRARQKVKRSRAKRNQSRKLKHVESIPPRSKSAQKVKIEDCASELGRLEEQCSKSAWKRVLPPAMPCAATVASVRIRTGTTTKCASRLPER